MGSGAAVDLVWPTGWASVVCVMQSRLVVAHLLWASVSPSDITTGVHSGSWASMALTGDWLGRCCEEILLVIRPSLPMLDLYQFYWNVIPAMTISCCRLEMG